MRLNGLTGSTLPTGAGNQPGTTSTIPPHQAWQLFVGATVFVLILAWIAGSYPPAKPVITLVMVGSLLLWLMSSGSANKFSSFTSQYL